MRFAPLLLIAASLPAAAIDSQLLVNMNVHATSFIEPGAGEVRHTPSFELRDDPRSAQLTLLSETASFAGGYAVGRFEGGMGLLRTFASASFPYCCDLAGRRVNYGYAGATVQGRFYDSIVVRGAGLAVGTPVSYTLNFSIDGHRSNPSFEIGGFLSASAAAEVRLGDLTTRETLYRGWDASRDANGSYQLTLNTQVGNTLFVAGMLYAGASVSDYAQGRYAEADYGHSAGYQLTASVAGLNTTGASGYDFSLSPVPEPAAWLLMGLGLLGLAAWRQSRPCSPPPSSKSGASSAPPTANGVTARR